MARWIKTDGTEQEVLPANGVAFTLEELERMIPGFGGELITLTGRNQGGLCLFMDDESSAPINQVATALLHQYRTDHADTW
jgi:hypothetical protein